jgi:metal-responsive CopG/Arc/MetJ family transcriptional regulator
MEVHAMTEKVRVNLQMSQELYDELEGMANESATTKSEIVRRAFSLLKAARQSVKKGYHLGTVKDAEKLDQEFVGL